MKRKMRVGVLGATGFVGQRLITLLDNHPYFDVTVIAASERSCGRTYEDVLKGKWKLKTAMPTWAKDMVIKNINAIEEIKNEVDFVFCAVNMPADEIRQIEEAYAKAEIPVVSNNSAHRLTKDVPVIIPEINPEHLEIIPKQRERLGTKRGFIVAKPNCSIQSYVPAITALLEFKPTQILVCTYQAVSGSGKTLKEWPEMNDNVIPYIGGEEKKSEEEPLKVWGSIQGDEITLKDDVKISAQCIRVPVSDGHLAAVYVNFDKKPSKEEIIEKWNNYTGRPQELELPLAPKKFLTYFEEDNRPQTALDRDLYNGMGITIGRLREDNLFDYKFVGLSHNTLRGAAGGAMLTAELLYKEGYFTDK